MSLCTHLHVFFFSVCLSTALYKWAHCVCFRIRFRSQKRQEFFFFFFCKYMLDFLDIMWVCAWHSLLAAVTRPVSALCLHSDSGGWPRDCLLVCELSGWLLHYYQPDWSSTSHLTLCLGQICLSAWSLSKPPVPSSVIRCRNPFRLDFCREDYSNWGTEQDQLANYI